MPYKDIEKRRAYSKAYSSSHKQELKEYTHAYDKNYYQLNKDKIKKKTRLWRKNNRVLANTTHKKWREKNKEKIQLYYKAYYKHHVRLYRVLHRKDRAIKHNIYVKNRKKIDAVFRLRLQTRTLIHSSLNSKSYKKNTKTELILGCSIEFFVSWIEAQLPKGKTLHDLGRYGYHIDHIIPTASAKTKEEVIKLCHYTNLRPLWWRENLSKGSRVL